METIYICITIETHRDKEILDTQAFSLYEDAKLYCLANTNANQYIQIKETFLKR